MKNETVYDDITWEDCILLHYYGHKDVIINDGHVIGFEEN